MTLAATLAFLSSTALTPQGGLQLPPRETRPTTSAPAATRPLTEVQQFRRDLRELSGPGPKVEARLQEIVQKYPAVEPLILEVARAAQSDELQRLILVARRVGTPKVADELLFQALARPIGGASRPVLEVVYELKGADGKKALQDCIKGRIPGTRRAAADIYVTVATLDDLHFALQISAEQGLDLQLTGVQLLAVLNEERARQRLLELLAKEPPLAAAACQALIAQGAAAVPTLQKAATEPPIDRGFAYTAFALAQIGDATGQRTLGDELAPKLLSQLRLPDVPTRVLTAIALADLAFRSDDADPQRFGERDIVNALLEVVAPTAFVPSLDLLRQPAEDRLVRLTGRIAVADGVPWRDWWQGAQTDFAGMRARVRIDEQNAAVAVLTLKTERGVLRVIAEGLADLPPLPGAREVLVTKDQMVGLIGALKQAGFLDPNAERPLAGLPLVRHLQLQVQGARTQASAPVQASAQFEQQLALVEDVARSEQWQLFRHPTDEPDRAAFWRTERRWLDANPRAVDRTQRMFRRVLKNWDTLSESLRNLAIETVAASPDRRELLAEADGERLLAIIRGAPEFGVQQAMLLDIACLTPGDRVWRDCVALACQAGGADRKAVDRVFTVLGPDRVLAALADERPVVRRAAIEQVAAIRDVRAGSLLVKMLRDPEPNVQIAAVFACGQIGVEQARLPLIEVIANEDSDPELRRAALRALGKVGGDGVFAVLQRSISAPDQKDKEAALRGLGELKEPRAAAELANLFLITIGTANGDLARFYLQRLGAGLAVPALRQLLTTRDSAARAQVVLLLGAFQDPEVIPDLVELLRQGIEPVQVTSLLAGTIGVDLAIREDRVGFLEQWQREHRGEAQWQWLLEALRADKIDTGLKPEMFQVGAGLQPVPELARLLVEAKEPRLRVLCAAVLRTVTREDFGLVSQATPKDVLEGIAARYRIVWETSKAAQGR
ncbi:MAG: HEAT repeat domain-containing protein [Planctomycetes bacterium]|nr:HEAT repeat domain-containing protein [Planctomycetota bacterium]